MYCKLCGGHLYKRITFSNIFKFNYAIHEDCEETVNKTNDYITFPFLDKLLLFDYLFEKRFEDSDEDFLYKKYSYIFFDKLLNNSEWSTVVISDVGFDESDLILVTKLSEKAILILNVFNENFMKVV